MERVSEFIVKKRKWILACFIILVIISGIASKFVKVNHDMVQYLPDSSSVKKGVNLMNDDFDESTSISVMFADLDSEETMQQVKTDLANIENVSSVTFDSASDENVKDGYALYTVNIAGNAYDSKAQTILKQIQTDYHDHEMYMAGSVVDQAESAKGLSKLFIVALSILLVILFVMCHSWIEPFLFLIPIGIAVMINSGTNVMFSSISSMTSSVASILQLALSMDYSFMVMERYRQEQKLTNSKEVAMQKALAHGFVSISSSSITTVVGMLCLVFMSFTIGKDMGYVLAKGVLISLICIFCVLPALILMFDKALMKTKKKVPAFKMNKIAAFSYRFRYGILVLFLLLLAGSFVIQGKAGITYAVESSSAGKVKIESIFPAKTSLVVLYDNEDEDKVSSVIPELETLDNVDAVNGYGNTLGKTFTAEEMAEQSGMNQSMVQLIYYDFFTGGTTGKIRIADFIDFIQNDVMTDPQFADYFNEDIKEQMNSITDYTDADKVTQEHSAAEMAQLTGMSAEQMKMMYLLYFSQQQNVVSDRMTMNEFVSFLQNSVINNDTYASMLGTDVKNQIAILSAFTDQNQIKQEKSAQQLASLVGMDEATIKQIMMLYYSNYGGSDAGTMTLPGFVSYIQTDIMKQPQFAAYFDDNTKMQLNTFSQYTDVEMMQKKLSASEIAQMFHMDASTVQQLLMLYYSQNGAVLTENLQISVNDFINFIVNDLSQNSAYSGMFDATTYNQLKMAQLIIGSSIANTTYTSDQMASLTGMDASLLRQLYYYHMLSYGDTSGWTLQEYQLIHFLINDLANNSQYSAMLDANAVAQLSLLQKLMDGAIANTTYTYQDIAGLTGMDAESIKTLYVLKGLEENPGKWNMSLQTMLHYLLDDLATNETYASSLEGVDLTQLSVARQIVDAVADKKELSPQELSGLFTNVSDQLDTNTVELLYMLYASNQYSLDHVDAPNKVSMDQLFDFLVTKVIDDPRFSQFFDEATKEQLRATSDSLSTGKQSLVGEHYSRLIVTTSYGGESDEVYHLIDQMKETLDGSNAQYYIIGDSAMSKELSGSFAQELLFITLLTAIAIFIVVAIAFRSISIPIVLVSVIQCAIFTAMSIAYFQGISTYFICLLIVQAILMGASIDYAILYTSYYKVERLNHTIKEAITASYNGAISTILTSASILVIVTFAISKVFTDPTTSQVCATISKGALIATILVIFVLPSLLAVFDRFIVHKGKKKSNIKVSIAISRIKC